MPLLVNAPHLPPPGTHRPAGHTGDLWGLPATILLAADQWLVALGQPLQAPVTKHRVHLIAQSRAAKQLSQGQLWWGPTGHCRADTIRNREPGSMSDSSQNRDEEERSGPQSDTKKSRGSEWTHLICYPSRAHF